MKHVFLAVLLLCLPAFAQRPRLRQAKCAQNGAAVTFDNNVLSGSLIFVGTHYENAGTPAATDSLGSTYTAGSTASNGVLVTALWASAASAGADTVTVTGASGFVQTCVAEFINTSATKDVDGTATGSGTPATISKAVTTTKNGDLVIGFTGGFQSSGVFTQTQPMEWATTVGGNDSGAMGYQVAGVAGSVTSTFANTNNQASLVVTAFQPNSINVTTTSLHSARTTASYSETLQAVGGSGAYTWSINSGSLPTGLSLSSAGVITGTCTNSASGSITFHVTDGSTSANSSAMTLTCGTSVGTVTKVQGNGTASSSPGFTLAFSSNVTSGNCLVVAYQEDSSSNNLAAALRSVTDSRGTTYTPIFSAGAFNGTQVFVGTAPSSGANTVTVPLITTIALSEWSGTQCTPDTFTLANGKNGTVASTALTTITANSLLLSVASGFRNPTVLTVGGSFTNVTNNNGSFGALYIDSVASTTVGSYSSTYTMTGSGADYWNVSLLAFRPSVSGAAPSSGSLSHRGSGVW